MVGQELRKSPSSLNKALRELPRQLLSSTWPQNGPKILPEGIQNHSKCPHNDKRSSSWCSFLLWDHNEDITINVWTCKPSQLEPQTVPEGLVPSSWRRFCGPHAFEWTTLIFPPIFPPFTLWEKDSGHLSVTGLSPLCIHQRWRRYVIFLLFNHSPLYLIHEPWRQIWFLAVQPLFESQRGAKYIEFHVACDYDGLPSTAWHVPE